MNNACPVAQELSAQPRRRVRREKTFTGCWSCRSRKVKCDEIVPECSPCRKRGFRCGGYQPIPVWIAPNQNTYQPGSRRVLQSNLTWRGCCIYDSSTVDNMIAECDVESLKPGVSVKSAGPFTVFASKTVDTPYPRASLSDVEQLFGELKGTQLRSQAHNLFHHYTSRTAFNMMPFQDSRNPWLSFYPSMARSGCTRGQKSLLYAILAQAAGNLAHLGNKREEMLVLAMMFYGIAIKLLRESLEEKAPDFSIILASILTLVMAEVYSGKLVMAEVYSGKHNSWKVHLKGAWNFLMMQRKRQPWQRSEEAWVTAQSLCLLKIRSDTMEHAASFLEMKQSLIFSVASRDDFGFTVGASQGLIRCIYDITSLASQQCSLDKESYQSAIEKLYGRIVNCNLQVTASENVIRLHHKIFKAGVMIHFHRRLLNSTPRTLVPYINTLLRCVTAYQSLKGGYVTLWPVFVGAVEAYQEEHKCCVRTWLDTAEEIGAASRGYVRALIEDVWLERKCKRDKIGDGAEEGDVAVDWRKVMERIGMDVLLV